MRLSERAIWMSPFAGSHSFDPQSIDLQFNWKHREDCTVYKIVYSDVTEKPETRLSY